MKTEPTELPGTIAIQPQVFGDDRGFFLETYNRERYRAAGIAEDFVQDNVSRSRQGVLRGLHFQNPNAQGKLVQVYEGKVWDVAVDIRPNSPHFKKWTAVVLDGERKNQFYVPPGFAHGFVVLSETALFAYKCTSLYDPSAERSIAWNDPEIGIEWPVEKPSLSAKDEAAPSLADFDTALLPTM